MAKLATAKYAKTLTAVLALTASVQAQDSAWIPIWNGNNLSDWDIKFTGKPLNENFRNTFKAVDGVLTLDYSAWSDYPAHGHAAYKVRTFSHYLIRAEYQIGPTQAKGGPGWAFQNNGLMLHSQSMASMALGQDFPASLEAQLLGAGNTGADNNSTMNLCTPGTGFYSTPTGGSLNSGHCYSAATTPRPEPGVWAWVGASVMGDSIIRHYVGPGFTSTPVFTFYRPVYLAGGTGPTSGLPPDGTRLTSGYIAIQSESHPFKFRKIEVLDLEGCMDKSSPAYRAYFVKSKPSACAGTGARPAPARPEGMTLGRIPGGLKARGLEGGTLEVATPDGVIVHRITRSGAFQLDLPLPRTGLYMVRWASGKSSWTGKWTGL